MRTQTELREALHDLARSTTDVPDMPVDRPERLRQPGRAVPVLVGVCLLALLAGTLLGVGRLGSPVLPAAPPSLAVPATTPSPVQSSVTPSTPPSPAADAPLTMRPMTSREISTRTAACTAGRADVQKPPRRGELQVRYAMVQAAAGYPRDGQPRAVLLLEDDGGYFDCSESTLPPVAGDVTTVLRGWYGKGGDSFRTDSTARGHELPTLSGGSECGVDRPRGSKSPGSAGTAAASTQVVVATSPAVRAARVTLTARGGTRVVTVPARTGSVDVPVRVTGAAARKAWRVQVELLDADGDRLPVQPYGGSTSQRLRYDIPPCR